LGKDRSGRPAESGSLIWSDSGISKVGWLVSATLSLCLSAPVLAQDDEKQQRFRIDGDRLFYDTTVPVDGKELDIRYSDVEGLRDLLRGNDGIKILEINSTGGGHYPSMDIAALVIDFDLDTHVENTCESSCVNVYLGGNTRTMARGARIGFHQLSWNERSVEDYYNKHRERREWDTPFKFAEWMYQDTQTETYNRLDYMVKRGVDAQFAIRTIRKPDTSMWFPYRSVLQGAGVVTE
jgi:hypothetical protein